MVTDLRLRRFIEKQKAQYQQQMEFHKKNVILQSAVSVLLIAAGLYYSRKQDPILPFIIAPSMAVSLTKLESSERKRRYYKKKLNDLEKD